MHAGEKFSLKTPWTFLLPERAAMQTPESPEETAILVPPLTH
jgi:hypothetical protein